MILDSSAIIAFLRREPEADRIETLLNGADDLRISAFTLLECRTVLWRRFGDGAMAQLELLIQTLGVAVEPFDSQQSALAFEAYRRYGKGTGHPAQLNLGDCAAYALAKLRDQPLLYKGDDFTHTDVERKNVSPMWTE